LFAAGQPVLSYDGRRVVFAGKNKPGGDWQIYETSPNRGAVRALTSAGGGAMDPALLPDGSLVYVSPVPAPGVNDSPTRHSALYVQPREGQPHQLTFGSASISNPTVLSDGRILFVSSGTLSIDGSRSGPGLYTINNDGTEVTAFAGQHDDPITIRRPRQLEDGPIAFLVTDSANSQFGKADYVLSSRPFAPRAPLLSDSFGRIRSIQPADNGDLVICAEPDAGLNNCCGVCGVFRVNSDVKTLGTPVLMDPDWDAIEAAPIVHSQRPMGRLSNVDFTRKTGQILCLDANNTTYGLSTHGHAAKATRIRVFTQNPAGTRSTLGDVNLQADGSFMAEVSADIPLGFEAFDEAGKTLRQCPPLIWVRPGENRSCIGCHEPHNHSPRNVRPMAVWQPVPKLSGEVTKLAHKGR
jgi:hypothetical protein